MGPGSGSRGTIMLLVTVMAVGIAAASGFTPVTSNQAGTVLAAPDGPAVTLVGDTGVSPESGGPDANTVRWVTEDGEAVFSSDGPTEAEVHAVDITGEWTRVTAIDAGATELSIDPGDKPELVVGGGITEVEFGEAVVGDGNTDVVIDSNQGEDALLGVHQLEPGATVGAYDKSGEQLLAAGTTGENGAVVFEFESPGSAEIALVESDGPPQFDGESMEPSDDEFQGESEVELSVDVDDPDFPETDVEVDFYVGGSHVGTDTLSDAGTASVTTDEVSGGGSHEWHAVAEDDFGQETTSPTETFAFPAAVEIRNETAPHGLIDSIEVEVVFYFDEGAGETHSRQVEDGTVDMTGLPVDEPFIVAASADGYYDRRIPVTSLLETQTVYLLDEDEDAVDPILDFTDFTGDFPPERSVIEVQKNIDDEWRTIEGDYLGAAGEVTAQLSYNERHRVIVTNMDTGGSRVLGTFTPTEDATIRLEAYEADSVITVHGGPIVSFSPETSSIAPSEGVRFEARIGPGDAALEEYTVRAELGDGAVVYESTGSAPDGGTEEFELDLEESAGGELVLIVEWEDEEGVSGESTVKYSIRGWSGEGPSFISVLSSMPGGDGTDGGAVMIVFALAFAAAGMAGARYGSGVAGLAGLSVLLAGAAVDWIPTSVLVVGVLAWLVAAWTKYRP